MMKTKIIFSVISTISIIISLLVSPLNATEGKINNETAKTLKENVEELKEKETSDKRKKIMQEAVIALAETKKALKALDENNTKGALAALEVATGKLILILARDPGLALAPVDVDIATYDLYATKDSIKDAIKQSEDFLEDGEVQRARSLLTGLASEIVISVSNIPLATYPDAIKAITPLIDEGKIEEAKAGLQKALNIMVVTKTVIPLPIIRAQAQLKEAEKLTENRERSDDENRKLTELLDSARTQLEMAKMLGYGDKDDFKPMYDQLTEIAKKTEGGKSGMGFFDAITKQLSEANWSPGPYLYPYDYPGSFTGIP